jgi:DHA1 family tetracycline resistance protein-like MFS transporter
MNRPLAVLFLTIFVNLVGFGIIIPLLPFYAQTFGASPLAIGLLFATFSLSQLIASPILGASSDRWGRRPVLLFSLLGTVASFVLLAVAKSLFLLFIARIVDGLSGGNISTARAYIADTTTDEQRARAYGVLGAAFGLGFIIGPALSGMLSPISYTAPIWAAAALTMVAAVLAWLWLPETVHRAHAGGVPWWRVLPEMLGRPGVRRLLWVDFLYWSAQAIYQTTFALFGARRFGFDAPQIGYLLSAFAVLGVIVQAAFIGPIVRRFGEHRTFITGATLAAGGLGAASLIHSLPLFLVTLVPAAIGMGLCGPTIVSLLSRCVSGQEQGRLQGSAGALESFGRAAGPVWGHALLQRFGEGTAYASAAIALACAALLIRGQTPFFRKT